MKYKSKFIVYNQILFLQLCVFLSYRIHISFGLHISTVAIFFVIIIFYVHWNIIKQTVVWFMQPQINKNIFSN